MQSLLFSQPVDTQRAIASLLDGSELAAVARTCRVGREMINHENVWQVMAHKIGLPPYLNPNRSGVSLWSSYLNDAEEARGSDEKIPKRNQLLVQTDAARKLSEEIQLEDTHALIELAMQLQTHLPVEKRIFSEEDYIVVPAESSAKFSAWWRENKEQLNRSPNLSLKLTQRSENHRLPYRLPAPVFELSNLRSLSVSKHGNWSLPRTIDRLKKLESLSVQRAPHSDMSHIGALQNLQALRSLKTVKLNDLALNCLTTPLYQLPELTDLSLRKCNIVILPSEVEELAKLETLELGLCPLVVLPEVLAKLPRLLQLEIPAECCTKQAPKNLNSLHSLTLTRYATAYQAPLHPSWFLLPELETIAVHQENEREDEWTLNPGVNETREFRKALTQFDGINVQQLRSLCQKFLNVHIGRGIMNG